MTQAHVEAFASRARTDAEFRKLIREAPDRAFGQFELTDAERSSLRAQSLGADPSPSATARKAEAKKPEAPGGSLGGRPAT